MVTIEPRESPLIVAAPVVALISPQETWPLRHRVLRPMQRLEELDYLGDRAAESKHFGVKDAEGQTVGIVSLYYEPQPGTADRSGWRIRGMATAPEVRKRGVGTQLLLHCRDYVASRHGTYIWCNARVSAAGFYQKVGFVAVGSPFEIPSLGAHHVMRWDFK